MRGRRRFFSSTSLPLSHCPVTELAPPHPIHFCRSALNSKRVCRYSRAAACRSGDSILISWHPTSAHAPTPKCGLSSIALTLCYQLISEPSRYRLKTKTDTKKPEEILEFPSGCLKRNDSLVNEGNYGPCDQQAICHDQPQEERAARLSRIASGLFFASPVRGR